MVINALKQIKEITVDDGIHIDSNKISDISLNTFLTRNNIQDLSFDILQGNISIEELELHGLFNGYNMGAVFQDIVKLDEDTYVNSHLIFNNSDHFVDIYANNLYIERLNEQNEQNKLLEEPTDEDVNIYYDMYYEDLKADEIYVDGEFVGDIEGFDMDYYDAYRLSVTRDENITGKYTIRNGQVDYLQTVMVNEVFMAFIEPFTHIESKMMEKLYTGALHIEGNLIILKFICHL